jgi:hypothetical protein
MSRGWSGPYGRRHHPPHGGRCRAPHGLNEEEISVMTTNGRLLVVLDAKGEVACLTAAQRQDGGVKIINPFGGIVGAMPDEGFTPLARLEPGKPAVGKRPKRRN